MFYEVVKTCLIQTAKGQMMTCIKDNPYVFKYITYYDAVFI